jgi:hypothetical protein
VLLQDAVHDGKPEPTAAAVLFGGEERLEDAPSSQTVCGSKSTMRRSRSASEPSPRKASASAFAAAIEPSART